jgi:hypothetical protein
MPPPQFLAEQLTLSQPGGQIMPTTVLQAPPTDFQTLRRPCIFIISTKLSCEKYNGILENRFCERVISVKRF